MIDLGYEINKVITENRRLKLENIKFKRQLDLIDTARINNIKQERNCALYLIKTAVDYLQQKNANSEFLKSFILKGRILLLQSKLTDENLKLSFELQNIKLKEHRSFPR